MPDVEGRQSDLWRGLSLLGLSFNHLLLWPCVNLSFALRLTYQSVGWVSFASVFFAIAGVQWGRRAESDESLWQWNLRRAAKLFLWVLIATFLFIEGRRVLNIQSPPWQQHVDWSRSDGLLFALAGLRLPWLLDVIWLHGWLGLFATLLWSLSFLRSSARRLAAVSVLIWIGAQAGVFDAKLTATEAPSWHAWTGWQLLFVFGAISQRRDAQPLMQFLQRKNVQAILLVLVLFFCVCKNGGFFRAMDPFRQTRTFGPLFALNTAAWCLLLSRVRLTKVPQIISVLGRKSLWFYSLQCLTVYLLGSFWVFSQNQKFYSFACVIFILALMTFLAWLIFQRRSV